MSAAEYVGKPHTIIRLDTAKIVGAHAADIELSHMNTGNTRPYAHPRGLSTFRKFNAYPYAERCRLSDYSAVVELTVLRGVPEVENYVVKVEHGLVSGGEYRSVETLFRAVAGEPNAQRLSTGNPNSSPSV